MGRGRVPQPALDLGKVLGGSWGGPGRVWGGPWGCWEGPGRVQGWSWEGPRRVLEASSRDLGGQTEPNRTEPTRTPKRARWRGLPQAAG